jgi:hypothetical protein
MTIKNTSLQTTSTQIFIASTGQHAITTIFFCNVSTITNIIDAYAVPYGENPSPSTQILKDVSLPSGETFSMDSERFILEENDALYAKCSPYDDAITVTISSVATS